MSHSDIGMHECHEKNCWCKVIKKSTSLDDIYQITELLSDKLEKIEDFLNIKDKVFSRIIERLIKLEEHHIRQIDENRKISIRVDELSQSRDDKKPFVCPRCKDLTDCDMCANTGLVWG